MDEHSGNMPADSEDFAALRDLAQRLLMQPRPDRGNLEAPQLRAGQLPAGWLGDIPVPDGARLVGSLTRPTQSEAVFDSDQTPEQILAFYNERLLGAGWTKPGPFGMHGGFLPSDMVRFMGTTFCRSSRGPALRIQTFPRAGGGTDLRLALETDPRATPCGAQARMPMMDTVIPVLEPPPGARQWPEGGGGSPDRQRSDAGLETDLDPAAVAPHYEGQLARTGWVRQDGSLSDSFAWSTWTFQSAEGEPWQALFFVLKRPDRPGEYILSIRAQWTLAADASSGGGGWSMSIPH